MNGTAMQAYNTKWFQKRAAKEGLTNEALETAVREIADGLIDADLEGHVVKKRVGPRGRGRRGGVRTLVAFRHADKAFFIYGFAKNERANFAQRELKALRTCWPQSYWVMTILPWARPSRQEN